MPRGADFKNTGLVKSTPSGTVCLGGGPRLGSCGPSPTGVVWAGPNTGLFPFVFTICELDNPETKSCVVVPYYIRYNIFFSNAHSVIVDGI